MFEKAERTRRTRGSRLEVLRAAPLPLAAAVPVTDVAIRLATLRSKRLSANSGAESKGKEKPPRVSSPRRAEGEKDEQHSPNKLAKAGDKVVLERQTLRLRRCRP